MHKESVHPKWLIFASMNSRFVINLLCITLCEKYDKGRSEILVKSKPLVYSHSCSRYAAGCLTISCTYIPLKQRWNSAVSRKKHQSRNTMKNSANDRFHCKFIANSFRRDLRSLSSTDFNSNFNLRILTKYDVLVYVRVSNERFVVVNIYDVLTIIQGSLTILIISYKIIDFYYFLVNTNIISTYNWWYSKVQPRKDITLRIFPFFHISLCLSLSLLPAFPRSTTLLIL